MYNACDASNLTNGNSAKQSGKRDLRGDWSMRCTKGAMWRRWDLHLHTPASGDDYQDQSVTNRQIIEALRKNRMSAVAITDHHTMNVDSYLELRELASGEITIFPGIELRSELGGKQQIHFIGLFPEDLGESCLRDMWTDLQGGLNLTPTAIEARGGEQAISSDFAESCTLIHNLGGLVTVHAGTKANTIEELRNSDLFRQIQKKMLTLKHVDIMELGTPGDQKGYQDIVFPAIGTTLPLILASDNHDIKEYPTDRFVWIKTDPTFEGLKQVKYEPEGRVRIQEDMPESKRDYLVIDKVRFSDPSKKLFSDQWIEMNPNLNSIIGGKSSGKSLLLYHIAKTIAPEKAEKRIKGGDKSIRYDYRFKPEIDFEVQWRDGTLYKLSGDEQGKDRSITFIPQLYLNALAEEKGEGSDFTNVITNILVGNKTYAAFLSETNSRIDKLKLKLHGAVSKYLILRKTIIEEKGNLKGLGDKKAIKQTISSYEHGLKELRDESKFTNKEEVEYKALQFQKGKLQEQVKRLTTEKELLGEIKTVVLNMAGDVLQFVIEPQFSQIRNDYVLDEDSLKTIDRYARELKDHLTGPLTTFGTEKFARLEVIDDEIKNCLESSAEIEGKIKPYEEKLTNKAKFEKLRGELDKEVQKKSAIERKELEIATLEQGHSVDEIFKVYRELYECYIGIVSELRMYSKIDVQTGIDLIAEVQFDHRRFAPNFSAKISKKTSLEKQFGEMFVEDNNDFVFRTDRHVDDVRKIFDKLVEVDGPVRLNSGFNLDDVVHALMDDNFYIEYDLKQGDDRLLQMSPGKRGIILFQLFLQLSNATTPILIDQPEDNLDNRTVYQELNNFIKRKKLDRQIIIVSHNANLVVSTDSEEIIVANQHGENKGGENAQCRFEYVTGALEDTFEDETEKGILYQKGIRNHVCEILEGGVEAFKKREQKYALPSN